ncbi:hypothetical protein [Paracoccus hibiscisoli]|uniref:hypothetical protein n=1 Tax=Paracoccus hibiscisoli TaxID=2023261 RepID=UPI0023F2CDD9|nr:hypothetical protein [Paracoccus hibiscisoli]
MAKKKPEKLSQFVPLLHQTMDCAAWWALTPFAKALYPYVRRRVSFGGENNGKISCSVREAAAYLGTSIATAAKALRELQAKGFIVAVTIGRLGVSGEGKATTWRLTEMGTPANRMPTKEYLSWSAGNDYPVAEVKRRAA